ncbi:hypothetical protein [Lederbergia ruris]|uniref:Uncharacterized protein n=1 Tax=Lederbergia ruris TaxID=217495 RepID=A0ABQ4KP42_9BACI|nr:hypothetical protein [Lederbergia ruris]GIN59704.1 hypothetical protein J8TS2_40230 [Lederbergia ruris]
MKQKVKNKAYKMNLVQLKDVRIVLSEAEASVNPLLDGKFPTE